MRPSGGVIGYKNSQVGCQSTRGTNMWVVKRRGFEFHRCWSLLQVVPTLFVNSAKSNFVTLRIFTYFTHQIIQTTSFERIGEEKAQMDLTICKTLLDSEVKWTDKKFIFLMLAQCINAMEVYGLQPFGSIALETIDNHDPEIFNCKKPYNMVWPRDNELSSISEMTGGSRIRISDSSPQQAPNAFIHWRPLFRTSTFFKLTTKSQIF